MQSLDFGDVGAVSYLEKQNIRILVLEDYKHELDYSRIRSQFDAKNNWSIDVIKVSNAEMKRTFMSSCSSIQMPFKFLYYDMAGEQHVGIENVPTMGSRGM